MQNAAGGKTERGEQIPSQQGRAGLRLQHALPEARVVYVSATGATTVHNLAYAQRTRAVGRRAFPFATRAEFVEAIEAGGVAAMEVLARDLKSLGLYAARSLSYEGVEYELVEHALTPEQRRIYDAYAGAFEVTGLALTDRDGTLKEELPPISQFLNRLLAFDYRPAEHPVRGVRGAAGGEDRGRHRVRNLRRRRRDHHGGVAQDRRAPHDLRPSGHRCRDAGLHHRAARPQRAAAARRRPGARRERAAGCSSTASRTMQPCRCRRPASCSTTAASSAACGCSRPLERPSIAVDALAATAWRPADPQAFAVAWEAELAQLPAFRESSLHVVTGLLLPIWRQLPNDGGCVYRLQTEEPRAAGPAPGGERVIGRQVSPAWVATACATAPELTPEDAFAGLMGGALGPASGRRHGSSAACA